MSGIYSKRAGELWGLSFLFAFVLDYIVFDFIHLVANMVIFYKLGEYDENFGSQRYLVYYWLTDSLKLTMKLEPTEHEEREVDAASDPGSDGEPEVEMNDNPEQEPIH